MRNVVKISELKSRFDVRYHTSSDAELGESWSLRELKAIIVREPNCYGFNYSTYGVPLIRISDMKQPFIDFSRVVRVSEEIHQTFKKTQLKPYDILISVRGMSTGKVSIFLGETNEANISPNIIIVRLKNTELAPYVTMVLISYIGQSQIKRFFSGGGKPSLTAPMINRIEIPKPSDGRLKEINKLFESAKLERLQAQKLKEEIDAAFAKTFGGFRVKKSVASATTVKGLGRRWDPHYHNEGYVALRAFIEMYEGKSETLAKIASLKQTAVTGLNKKTKVEYIEIGSINNLTGVIEAPIVDYPDNLPGGPKVHIIDGDILISKVRPYLNANVVFHSSNHPRDAVASRNAFAVFDTAQLNFEHYVVAFLRSHIGLSQIVMYQSGTTYPTVSDDDVEKIRILFIPEDQMEVVNRNYKKYVEIKLVEEFTTKAILDLIQDEIEPLGGIDTRSGGITIGSGSIDYTSVQVR